MVFFVFVLYLRFCYVLIIVIVIFLPPLSLSLFFFFYRVFVDQPALIGTPTRISFYYNNDNTSSSSSNNNRLHFSLSPYTRALSPPPSFLSTKTRKRGAKSATVLGSPPTPVTQMQLLGFCLVLLFVCYSTFLIIVLFVIIIYCCYCYYFFRH